MKRRIVFTVLSVILVVTILATPAFAKDPDNEAQGKPFEELRDAIAAVEQQVENILSDMGQMADDIQSEVEETLNQLVDEVQSDIELMIEDAVAALQDEINEQLDDLRDQIGNISVGWDDISGIPGLSDII